LAGKDPPADLRGGGVQLSHQTPPPPGFVSEANTGTYIYYNENEETNPSTALANAAGAARLRHRSVCLELRSAGINSSRKIYPQLAYPFLDFGYHGRD
jgi:hypothetical protein